MASILIFEKNKKFLLYKILNKDILKLLLNELDKEYGEENENNLRSSSAFEEKQEETTPLPPITVTKKVRHQLTDDFIYGYFAPIINSYEISKEMNFVYEYALFNENQYIIRFTLYDNCLLLCIYSSINSSYFYSSQSVQNILPQASLSPECLELNKLIYNDYHTNWCSKSIISIIKYKFGICSDEKCFNEIDNELKNLFVKWSKLHSCDIIYFIESIEYLQINEETKLKCEAFVKEFIGYIKEQEQFNLELDFSGGSRLARNQETSDEDEDMTNFPLQSIKDEENSLQYDDIEDFFDDVSCINYYILSYGTKMLFKHDANLEEASNSDFDLINKASNALSSQSIQVLDSSSLFMILLESATFLNYTVQDLYIDESLYSFKSVGGSTPSLVSVENDENLNNNNNNNNNTANGSSLSPDFQNDGSKIKSSYGESFKSLKSFSTPMLSQTTNSPPFSKSPIDELKEFKLSSEEIDNDISNALNQSKLTDNLRVKSYKKTHCFLRNSNKSYNFYDVLFIKLEENLCFTLLKLSKLTKYCELITDIDTYLNELLIILNHKRLILTNIEAESKASQDSASKAQTSDSLEQQKQQQLKDESDEKKFLSSFINKLISFYEKLDILKNEINSQLQINRRISHDLSSSSSTITSPTSEKPTQLKLENRKQLSQNMFKFSYLRQRLNLNRIKSSSRIKRAQLTIQQQVIVESRLKQQLKLASNLQMKINTLIKNEQFIPSLNLQSILASKKQTINQILNNYQNIEKQVIQLKENLKNLLFDLFLSDKFKQKQEQANSYNQSSSTTPSTSTSSNTSFQLNAVNFMNCVKNVLKKSNLHLYTSFMEVKMKRNLAMTYYWHQFVGLIHFSFVNRQDNCCIVPTIESYDNGETSEAKINAAYRKYLPIIITFLYKYDCTQFQFIDSSLGVVINYFIWFEDKNANYIPVELNQQRANGMLKKENFNNNEKLFGRSKATYFNLEHKTNFPIGITLESYYDLLRKLCYPNAPKESLFCYELICLHSLKVNEKLIHEQCLALAKMLSQSKKK